MELSEITIGLNPNWELIEAKLRGTAYIKGGAIYYPKGLILGRESILSTRDDIPNEDHVQKALRMLKFSDNVPYPTTTSGTAKEMDIIDLAALFRKLYKKYN